MGWEITRRSAIGGLTGAMAAPLGASAQTLAAGQRTQSDKLREIVSLSDFAAPGGERDATPALERAIQSLGPQGGIVEIPPGDWSMNAVIARNNVTLRGKGGEGEYMRASLRPFDIARPTLTFGNGHDEMRYCGLFDLHVSGADGSRGSQYRASSNAPQALLLLGGTIDFTAFNCVFYNGVQTLALVPSPTMPVTTTKFIGCTIRNDLKDSSRARALYMMRHPDPGYITSNKFIATKLNGPPNGYAAEVDGTRMPATIEINDCYWDIRPDHGLLLRGGAAVICYNFQIDPGVVGGVIVETDGIIRDPARYFVGMLRHGGQRMRFGDGHTLDIPEEADSFSYRQRIASPFFSDLAFFAPRSMPYSTRVYYDWESDRGPMRWHGIEHRFTDTTDASEDLEHGALQSSGGLAVAKSLRAGGAVHSRLGYFVGSTQVLGLRQPKVSAPRGGVVVDSESRQAIAALIARLEAHGLIG